MFDRSKNKKKSQYNEKIFCLYFELNKKNTKIIYKIELPCKYILS